MMAEQKEPIIISVSDPGGIERDYVQDVVIPFAGKEFAVLVSIPEDGENVEEPEIILARVDTDKMERRNMYLRRMKNMMRWRKFITKCNL